MTKELEEYLERYDSWKAQRKLTQADLSPNAFIIDQAKEAAYDKVEGALGGLGLIRSALKQDDPQKALVHVDNLIKYLET